MTAAKLCLCPFQCIQDGHIILGTKQCIERTLMSIVLAQNDVVVAVYVANRMETWFAWSLIPASSIWTQIRGSTWRSVGFLYI